MAEFDRLMKAAGVTPFRRVGKVRIAFDPRTAAQTVEAAAKAVKAHAQRLVDAWGEPDGNTVHGWRQSGLDVKDVCDDPHPAESAPGVKFDPLACPVGWLVARCPRYHFRLTLTPARQVRGVGLPDGSGRDWDMNVIRPLLPGWFVDASRKRLDEIADHVAASLQAPPPDAGRDEAIKLMAAADAAVERLGVSGSHPALVVHLQTVAAAFERGDYAGVRFACNELEVAARELVPYAGRPVPA